MNSRNADANREFRLFWTPLSRVLVVETVVFFFHLFCNSIAICSFDFFISTDVLYVDIINPRMCLDRKSQLLPRTNS